MPSRSTSLKNTVAALRYEGVSTTVCIYIVYSNGHLASSENVHWRIRHICDEYNIDNYLFEIARRRIAPFSAYPPSTYTSVLLPIRVPAFVSYQPIVLTFAVHSTKVVRPEHLEHGGEGAPSLTSAADDVWRLPSPIPAVRSFPATPLPTSQDNSEEYRISSSFKYPRFMRLYGRSGRNPSPNSLPP
jgi:hypothetical protein